MKLNTLEKLLHALETLDNELKMDEILMKKGLQPLRADAEACRFEEK